MTSQTLEGANLCVQMDIRDNLASIKQTGSHIGSTLAALVREIKGLRRDLKNKGIK